MMERFIFKTNRERKGIIIMNESKPELNDDSANLENVESERFATVF